MSRTNDRRRGRDLHIGENDLATGRDVRRIVEQSWKSFRPVIELIADNAVKAERERAWWRRLLRKVGR